MRKIIFLLALLILSAYPVDAWTCRGEWCCTDTDEYTPMPLGQEVILDNSDITTLDYYGHIYEFEILGGNPEESTAILRINSDTRTVYRGKQYIVGDMMFYVHYLEISENGDAVFMTGVAEETYSWGNDGLLDGVSSGNLAQGVNMPPGCSGTKVSIGQGEDDFYYKDVVCTDYCNGGSLVEFYCGSGPYWDESHVEYVMVRNSPECIQEVPEFGPVAGAIALIGALVVFAVRRRH